jgi:hypothetical protein
MSSNGIRSEFIEKFGKAKYDEFVLSLYEAFPLRERLFFWQEKLLEQLFNYLGIPLPTLKEVYSIFNHCPIHDIELKEGNVPIINGNDRKYNFLLIEQIKLFPLANINAPRDLDRFEYPETINVLYCPQCRIVESSISNP